MILGEGGEGGLMREGQVFETLREEAGSFQQIFDVPIGQLLEHGATRLRGVVPATSPTPID